MRQDDAIRLRHMFDAAREALAFAAQRDRADLDHDRMLVFALMKDIEIIGEAANQISESGRTKLSNIPWQDIIAMRHRMVHAYFEINLDILWQTVRSDLTHLLEGWSNVWMRAADDTSRDRRRPHHQLAFLGSCSFAKIGG